MERSPEWYDDPAALLGELRQLEQTEARSAPQIDGYSALVEIARGGQGVVYSATQDATHRRVAIKVVHGDASSTGAARRRFEREIEVVASLQHPHIVRVYDSGVTGDGRLYLVMELIEGEPLDRFLATVAGMEDARSQEARLALFVKIARALNHAHQRGVIHRDLKPSNVRVDHDGEPHILDFGLAKTLRPAGVTHATVTTRGGSFVGSLPWSSPEQVAGAVEEIDVRSDIYALGVLMYQALSGTFPYDVSGSIRSVVNNIVEAEPVPLHDAGANIDRDLEAVVLKCLAKDKLRRYQSAGGLADDLERAAEGDPVLARSDNRWYTLGKSISRNRVAFAIGVVLAALLLTYGTTMGLLYAKATRAERSAREEGRRAEDINVFLMDMLSSIDPSRFDRRMTLYDVLDHGSTQLESAFVDDPITRARLLQRFGLAYAQLGWHDRGRDLMSRALALLEANLGPDDPAIADTLVDMPVGEMIGWERDLAGVQRAVAIYRAHFGDGDPRTLRASIRLADAHLWSAGNVQEAERQYASVVTALGGQFGPAVDEQAVFRLITAQVGLARCRQVAGDPVAAELPARRAVRTASLLADPEHEGRLLARKVLGHVLMDQQRHAEAEPELRWCVELTRRVLMPGHPSRVGPLLMLIETLIELDRKDEARELIDAAAGELALQPDASEALRATLARLTAPLVERSTSP